MTKLADVIERYVAHDLTAGEAAEQLLRVGMQKKHVHPLRDSDVWLDADDRPRLRDGTWGEVQRAWTQGRLDGKRYLALSRAVDAAAKASTAAAGDWNEEDHPRSDNGKFGPDGDGASTTPLKNQHGSAITPTKDKALIADVGRTLAAEGGSAFLTPERGWESEARAIVERGERWDKKGVTKADDATDTQCHWVAARLALSDTDRYAMVNGYARDRAADSMWISHSWVVDHETGKIIEPTTSVRGAYFGYELTADEARQFAKDIGA